MTTAACLLGITKRHRSAKGALKAHLSAMLTLPPTTLLLSAPSAGRCSILRIRSAARTARMAPTSIGSCSIACLAATPALLVPRSTTVVHAKPRTSSQPLDPATPCAPSTMASSTTNVSSGASRQSISRLRLMGSSMSMRQLHRPSPTGLGRPCPL